MPTVSESPMCVRARQRVSFGAARVVVVVRRTGLVVAVVVARRGATVVTVVEASVVDVVVGAVVVVRATVLDDTALVVADGVTPTVTVGGATVRSDADEPAPEQAANNDRASEASSS
jgi:hypothetical protein